MFCTSWYNTPVVIQLNLERVRVELNTLTIRTLNARSCSI